MFLISVIIPCFNCEEYISDALNSVLNQTYSNFEIICINDGSTDNTLNILNEYKNKHPDKIIIINSTNKGAPHARNIGLSYAQGDIIQFFDADDILDAHKFESQIIFFEKFNIDIVVSNRISKDSKLEGIINKFNFEEIENYPLNTVISKIVITGNPLYKKDFIIQCGMWDENLSNAQDWDLNLRAILFGTKIKYVPGDFLISRVVSNSLSSNWISVSKTKEKLIVKYWKDIYSSSEKLNENALNEIFSIFYNNLIYAKTKLEFSQSFINYKNILGSYYCLPFIERLIVKIIGFKFFLYLKRGLLNL